MIDKKYIVELLGKFATVYPNFKIPGELGFSIWYDALRDCDEKLLDRAVIETVKKCSYPPVIADVFQEYQKAEEQDRKEKQELRQVWSVATSMYPKSLIDDKAADYMFKVIKRIDSHDERMLYLQHISRCVNGYVREVNANDLPLLSEFLKEVCSECTG